MSIFNRGRPSVRTKSREYMVLAVAAAGIAGLQLEFYPRSGWLGVEVAFATAASLMSLRRSHEENANRIIEALRPVANVDQPATETPKVA